MDKCETDRRTRYYRVPSAAHVLGEVARLVGRRFRDSPDLFIVAVDWEWVDGSTVTVMKVSLRPLSGWAVNCPFLDELYPFEDPPDS